MAAWIVVGVLAGVVVGCMAGGLIAQRAAMQASRMADEARSKVMQPRDGDGELLERVLGRLLDATVPERETAKPADPQPPGWEAEYEEPVEEVGDWTDPFIGLERPLVARLAPGQGIPGLDGEEVGQPVSPVEAWQEQGEGAFDEWMRESLVPEGVEGMGEMGAESWVDPVRLDDE